ncbi:MAG: TraR/DksA C4-type zinc finger protein [Patescibacteria group bacterium]
MVTKVKCECGKEIPIARLKALAPIGGTNKCAVCQAKAEAQAKDHGTTHFHLRPIIADKAFGALGNAQL